MLSKPCSKSHLVHKAFGRLFSTQPPSIAFLPDYKQSKPSPPTYVVTPHKTPSVAAAAALTNALIIEEIPAIIKTTTNKQIFTEPTKRALVNSIVQSERAVHVYVPEGAHMPDTIKSDVVSQTFSRVYDVLVRTHGDEVQDVLPPTLWSQRLAEAYWTRDKATVQVVGRVDATMAVKVPLPSITSIQQNGELEPVGVDQLEDYVNRADIAFNNKQSHDPKNLPWIRRDDTFSPANKTAFKHYASFPALSVLVEYKPDLFRDAGLGQLLTYQVASAVAATSWHTAITAPFLQFGVLSSGRDIVFTAFQLNTLNFDSGDQSSLRNVFWLSRHELISSSNKVNLAAVSQLYRMLEYIYETQLSIGTPSKQPLLKLTK